MNKTSTNHGAWNACALPCPGIVIVLDWVFDQGALQSPNGILYWFLSPLSLKNSTIYPGTWWKTLAIQQSLPWQYCIVQSLHWTVKRTSIFNQMCGCVQSTWKPDQVHTKILYSMSGTMAVAIKHTDKRTNRRRLNQHIKCVFKASTVHMCSNGIMLDKYEKNTYIISRNNIINVYVCIAPELLRLTRQTSCKWYFTGLCGSGWIWSLANGSTNNSGAGGLGRGYRGFSEWECVRWGDG